MHNGKSVKGHFSESLRFSRSVEKISNINYDKHQWLDVFHSELRALLTVVTGTFLNLTRKEFLYLPVLLICLRVFDATAQGMEFYQVLPDLNAKQAQSEALQDKVVYPIQINRDITSLEKGEFLVLPIPSRKSLQLKIDKKWTTANGDVQLTGRFNNQGMAVITIGKDSVFASFSNQEHNYGIGMDENHQPFLIDHNASDHAIDLGDDMRMPADIPGRGSGKLSLPPGITSAIANNKSVITLLAIYSAEFAAGFGNPRTRINQMIAFTNEAYRRSGIQITLELAHARQIAFSNGANIGTLLDQATQGINAFSNVPAIRNQFFADMVAVLPFSNGGSVSGVAWVNGNREKYAFSVSQFAVWGSDSVFAHELGHNLGSGHERQAANPSQRSPCTGGYTGYSCGHGNGSQGTIMSYLDDSAWNYVFSNPTLNCNGEPCGIARGQTNSADNKTSFNITGPLVEAFRIDTSDDSDKDGIKNNVDNCPDKYNPKQLDTDSDGKGNVCDADDDGDGINDALDNCPLTRNPLQEDSDNNGQGDACQDDILCFPVTRKNKKITLICL